jgi:four helix bundle protein
MGSASELEYHLLLAHDLGFLRDAEYLPLQARAVGLKRMPSSLIVSLRKRSLPIREKVAD